MAAAALLRCAASNALLRLILSRRWLFIIHFQHVEDLGYNSLERMMAFAESVVSFVEPNLRFLELGDGRMQRKDREDGAVADVTEK
jgi:hypothetical protein